MSINTEKTKVITIKSKVITYTNCVYDNNNLDKVTSYKYLRIVIHHKRNWKYIIEKRINGGCKAYCGLENRFKSTGLWKWDNKKLLFETLITLVILYGCDVWGCNISRESWRNTDQIQKYFITYNLKIKGNTPYHVLLIEVRIPPIESTVMNRYLMYKNKITNMEDIMLPKSSSNSNENHVQLRCGWHKYVIYWLKHCRIKEYLLCKRIIIFKILLYVNLRRNCGGIKT
jgi:hypothetical protein